MPEMLPNAYKLKTSQVLSHYKVDFNRGLTSQQVKEATNIHGKNGI